MAAVVAICGDSVNFVEFIELRARTVEFPTHQPLIFFYWTVTQSEKLRNHHQSTQDTTNNNEEKVGKLYFANS